MNTTLSDGTINVFPHPLNCAHSVFVACFVLFVDCMGLRFVSLHARDDTKLSSLL